MVDFKIASSGGKGGIGKSMLASSLSILFNEEFKTTAVDCDVDAPNLGIWLGEIEQWNQVEEISVSERPVIDSSQEDIQQCADQCRFNALEVENGQLKLNPFLCEGCGACQYFCPAVKEMKEVQSGWIKTKETEYGFPLIVGQLKPGEAGSGEIVTELKKRADEFESELQIIDSAPGTGCPVVAALQDVNFVILATEPTKSGLSDLKKVKQVVDHFGLNFGVVVNKWNVNKKVFNNIKSWSGDNFLGKIDYDQDVIKAASELTPVVETKLGVKKQIKQIFKKVKAQI